MVQNDLQIRLTEDGSTTLFDPVIGEPYHSLYGAIGESMHVFIEAGLRARLKKPGTVRIIEIGLGTGLNVLLTYIEAATTARHIEYTVIEPNPIKLDLAERLNYPHILGQKEASRIFHDIHFVAWNKRLSLSSSFYLTKKRCRLQDFSSTSNAFDLVYFDAFSPEVQQELWTEDIFRKLAAMAMPGCILVTYSAKGEVRRNLVKAGFETEKLPGPKGKREMLRAVRV